MAIPSLEIKAQGGRGGGGEMYITPGVGAVFGLVR